MTAPLIGGKGREPVPVPSLTDGVVAIRATAEADLAVLVSGRDAASDRWLAAEYDGPPPAAVILVGGEVVGWVDYDIRRPWLEVGEVNLGYQLFADKRGQGYATRAVLLLLRHLALHTDYQAATLAIDPANHPSLALAARIDAVPAGSLGEGRYFKLPLGPSSRP